MEGDRICDYTADCLLRSASNLLRQSYALAGFKPPETSDLAILTSKLASDLAELYPYLTISEVSLCLELGVKGEYGDFMGINMRTIIRWLKAYLTSELRYKTVVERDLERSRTALPPVSEAYKEERERAFLRKVFEQYKAGYPLERLYPARVYQSLQERGLIHDTPQEKRHAMSLFAHWRPAGHLPISEDIRQILVRQQAMAWLLKRYFDGLIAQND